MQSQPPLARIGTRGSALALTQARLVQRLLAEAHGAPLDAFEIVPMTTTGDRITDRPLSEAGGKGLFTKELETALFAERIDLAVHSSKDVSTILPSGLEMPVFLEREDVRDAFVSRIAGSIDKLPHGARFGTSSIRRAAQVRRYRPDLAIVGFRGNVDTRLKKLDDGVADATLLAAAGLNRLGRQSEITAFMDPQIFPPAPAQGAIGIEIRSADERMRALVAPLNHQATHTALVAERAMLAVIDGSCRTPVAALTSIEGGQMALLGELLTPDGTQVFRVSEAGAVADAVAIGAAVGAKLLADAGSDFVLQFAS